MAGSIAEAKPKAASPGGLRRPERRLWAAGLGLCGPGRGAVRHSLFRRPRAVARRGHDRAEPRAPVVRRAGRPARLRPGCAPVGWVYLHKALWELTHNLELGLRLTSFASTLATLVLFRGLAFRELDRFGALAATALICLSSPVVIYAANVKPYAVDILLRGDDPRRRHPAAARRRPQLGPSSIWGWSAR